jgi:vacuolar-type H+-ATPase subunit I/STV1
MAEVKYTRAIVNCGMLQASCLEQKLPRNSPVEGAKLAALIAHGAHISADPNSGAPLLWDLASAVPDVADIERRKREAEAEAKALQEEVERLQAEKEAELAAKAEAEAAAAKEAGENVKEQLLKKPGRKTKSDSKPADDSEKPSK